MYAAQNLYKKFIAYCTWSGDTWSCLFAQAME